jgi:hypothetical protein
MSGQTPECLGYPILGRLGQKKKENDDERFWARSATTETSEDSDSEKEHWTPEGESHHHYFCELTDQGPML